MKRLNDKVAIITGGSRGIGYAIAEKYAKEGAKIFVADILEEESKKAVESLKKLGVEADYCVFDASKVDDIYRMTDACVERFGRVDILVPCAGVQVRCPSLKLSEKDFDFVMDINIKGVFFCCQAAGRQMRKQGGGHIVCISSGNSQMSHLGRAPYCISKRGVNALVAVLGAEWAMYGIQVNAIAPGWLKTAMPMAAVKAGILDEKAIMSIAPIQRWGNVEEIANLALYLASDESSYIVGQTIFCDGGWNTGILPNALDYIKENDTIDY